MHNILFVTICLVALVSPAVFAEPITVIPPVTDVDQKKASIGKDLFIDTRLSKDGDFSCNTCHLLDKYGVDHVPASLGARFGKRNSPTIYNVRFNFKQLWDGRADDLHQQINKLKFVDWEGFSSALKKDAEFVTKFKSAFNQGVSIQLIKDAIVEYEKTLVTPNSPFDQYLMGNASAISKDAKQGYSLFKKYGCVACHQGANVGGNIFQKFGVIKDINLRENSSEDFGRFNITKNEWDKYVFKVPSLRLAVHTAPYFHDGSIATLEQAIDIMIEFQLQRTVPKEEREQIIEFLKTLPGELNY